MTTRKPYHYIFTTEYCPVCGHEKKYKERASGKNPKDFDKTHKFVEIYDYCNSL